MVLLLLASSSFGAAVLAAEDVPGEATVRVMTQNLFMGTDFPELLAAQDPAGVYPGGHDDVPQCARYSACRTDGRYRQRDCAAAT